MTDYPQNKPTVISGPAWRYTKRVLRDAFLLMAVVIAVSWAQSFKFTGKALNAHLFQSLQRTLQGEMVSLRPSSEILLVYVFAPWCKVCHFNAGVFDSLVSTDSLGYEIKGLALSYENLHDVEKFVTDTGFKPLTLLSDEALESELTKNLGIKEFPTFLVLSRNGEVLTGWSGYTTSLGLWVRMWGIRFFSSHLT